jgi:hypothetical protein
MAKKNKKEKSEKSDSGTQNCSTSGSKDQKVYVLGVKDDGTGGPMPRGAKDMYFFSKN